jgi:hypothetical protein
VIFIEDSGEEGPRGGIWGVVKTPAGEVFSINMSNVQAMICCVGDLRLIGS